MHSGLPGEDCEERHENLGRGIQSLGSRDELSGFPEDYLAWPGLSSWFSLEQSRQSSFVTISSVPRDSHTQFLSGDEQYHIVKSPFQESNTT